MKRILSEFSLKVLIMNHNRMKTLLLFFILLVFVAIDSFSQEMDRKFLVIDSIYKINPFDNRVLAYSDSIVKVDTCNTSALYYKGCYYDVNGHKELAKNYYFRVIQVDSCHFEAIYNLGVLFYNESMAIMEVAVDPMTNEQFIIKLAKGYNLILLAKVFFDRAFEIYPEDKNVIEILKVIKYRMRRMKQHTLDYPITSK